MSYKFTLILDRTITDEESGVLQEDCSGFSLSMTTHPTKPEVTVTQLEYDTEGPSLAEAIQSALDAVKTVSDLSTASLEVPAQPDGTSGKADEAAKPEDLPTEDDAKQKVVAGVVEESAEVPE
jgi:hypothetical protein